MSKLLQSAVLLLATLGATPTLADQAVSSPESISASECGGQYECVVSRPLTAVEVRTARGAPPPPISRDPEVPIAQVEILADDR
jgi:hypothetical protein